MKQYLRIFSMLLLMLIGIGGGDVFGAEETVTFDATKDKGSITQNGSGESDELKKEDITISTTNGVFGNGTDYRSYANSKLTVSSADKTITKIVFTCTNSGNNGPAKASTKTGNYNYSGNNGTWTGSSTSIEFSCSAQIRITKIEVTIETESKTTTTTTFGESYDNQTIQVKKGEETTFISPTATLTPSEAGSLTYSSSYASAISVDSKTGVISFNDLGKATITANFAGSETHLPSSASYTIEYYDPSAIVFSNENGAFANIPTSGYISSATSCNLKGSDENTYAFICNNLYKNYGNIQMKGNIGTITSPIFEFTYGYKVNVYYFTSNNATPLSITSGAYKVEGTSTGETGTNNTGTGFKASLSILNASASFEIKAGGNACFVSKIEVIKFTEPQKQEAIVTFPVASYTTLPGESFTAPTASVKNAEGNVISGATVTYSISGDDIATIDANTGAVTPKADAFGTATITATYAGDANYKEATGSYTLAIKEVTVASDIANLITQGTADNTKLYGINLTQAQVLKVHGTGIYLSNGTSFIAVKSLTNDAVVEGKLLSGKLIGKYSLSASIPTLTLEKEPTLNIEEGTSILAGTSINADEAENHINELVTISGTTSIRSSKQFLDNVQLYDKYSLSYAAPYTGSKLSIRGVIINYNNQLEILPLSKYDIIYHFDEAASNAVGAAADVKVQLTRTLSKDYWNTFCVPFSMTAEQIAATFGEGTKVTEYASTDGTTLNFTEATAITAGVPYLIKPATTTANPAIEGVTIAAGDAQEKGSTYKFIGIYSPKALATDGSELFIGTDSQLYSPAADKNTINGMRAYLNVPAGTEGARLNILGEMVTAIDGVSLNGNDEVKVFNLKGQRVGNTTKGLAKGIYVVNGKKMVINK